MLNKESVACQSEPKLMKKPFSEENLSLAETVPTKTVEKRVSKIKKTFIPRSSKTQNKKRFKRGANHPSFFLRQFFTKITGYRYQHIYQEYEDDLDSVRNKAFASKSKRRHGIKDLDDFFGPSSEEDHTR